MTFKRFLALGFAACMWFAGLGMSFAHPHIWITAQAVLNFNDEGQIETVRHVWLFDPAFSAWAVQGLDIDGENGVTSDEMQELAELNLRGLAEYGYYTYAGNAEQDIHFIDDGSPRMSDMEEGVVLDFTLYPDEPIAIGDGFELAVLDQEYYVAIDYVAENPVQLVNAPENCVSTLVPPQPLDPEIEARLFSIGPDVTELPSDLKVFVRDTASKIRVTCGAETVSQTSTQTALEATSQLASSQPALPFGGPAVERGLPVPRDGFLGWIYQVQQSFYRALTQALAALQTDNQAIWILGGLSFLYGVFHAAGPGHGKMVISSYVLATERQISRGVIMSFASAFVQAVTAVTFVLIASLLLRATSVAMGNASQWLIIGSYALVVLLGLWLIVRHVFGLGHSHHHHEDAHAHDHAHHDHDHGHHHDHSHSHAHAHHDHAHNVTPEQTQGTLWEQMGVVLSVGLRPCSGALVVLVFALSQGLLLAGIVATFLMALGTGITVAILASFAVFFKGALARFGGGSRWMGHALWWLELLGAILVLAFGVIFLMANI